MKSLWAFMTGLSAMVMAGMATYASMPASCKAFPPPVVKVHYETSPVRYDYSKSVEELSAIKSDTADPYGPGAHTYTEGLRADRPTIETRSSEKMITYPLQGLFCIGYDTIDVTVRLKPTIYIANRWRPGRCRDAILAHEERHVKVDHEVMDDFVPRVRAMIHSAVKKVGTMGPLHLEEEDTAENFMTRNIQVAVDEEIKVLHAKITERQSHVDTLAEYQRVSRICESER
jgi:hypothetical protein